MTPRTFVAALIAAPLIATNTAHSQAAQRGGFVVTLGTDTVQVEQFTRNGSRIDGVVATRIPTVRVAKYTATVNADGTLARYEVETSTGDGTPVRTTGTAGSLTILADSTIRETIANGQPVTQRIATPNGAVVGPVLPYVGTTFLLYEFAHAQARKLAKGASESSWYLLPMIPGQLQPQRIRVWFFGPDSAEADYFGVARSAYKFDAKGRLLRADWGGTTYKYRVAPVSNVDAAVVARGWSADDKRGAGFGVASPRDSVRASVGAAYLFVDYSRPSKRGRKIWGALVPFDTVWRFGADFATHFSTTASLTIGSAKVPAGSYTLWMLPTAQGAQLVISKAVNVFGTGYNPANDLARIPFERAATASPVERFTIAVTDGRLVASWDDAAWSVPIVVGPADAPSRETLIAADRRIADIATRDGVRAAFGAALAADGALLYPGAPVASGSDRVASLLAAQPLLDSVRVRWQPITSEISADSRFGMTYGFTTSLARGVPDPSPRMGSYAIVWKWNESAGWRVVAATLSGVVAPERTVLTPSAGPVELAPLAASGAAARFIETDLEFSKLANSATPAIAFRTYAAPNAITLAATGQILRGPDEVGGSLANVGPLDWTWYPVIAGASDDGSFGFTIGQSTSKPRGNATAPANLSKYLSIWQRQADGTLRFLYDGGNARPAK